MVAHRVSAAGPDVVAVGIVGLGPMGLQCLERLLAHLHGRPTSRRVHIHVFHDGPAFGESAVYRAALPSHLVLNNANPAEIDLFASADPPAPARIADFAIWREAGGVATRAEVGRYLSTCFSVLARALPGATSLVLHHGEVVDLTMTQGEVAISLSDAPEGEGAVHCRHVVLATGHGGCDADDPGPSPGPSIEGASPEASASLSGRRVAIRGFGLAALDLILGMTEGAGGSFEPCGGESLAYRASGREPAAILPFSRSGLPIFPSFRRDAPGTRGLRWFTVEQLRALEIAAGGLGQAEMLPLMEAEFAYHYLRALPGAEAALAAIDAQCRDVTSFRRRLERLWRARPDLPRFSLEAVLDPPADPGDWNRVVRRRLTTLLEAAPGSVVWARRSALSSWYEISLTLEALCRSSMVEAGALNDLREVLVPKMRRIGFGTHPVVLRKLVALIDAGIVDLRCARDPRMLPSAAGGVRILSATGGVASADLLIEGRLSGFDLCRSRARLYRNLAAKGFVREHRLRTRTGAFRTGAIDVTARDQRVIDAHGAVNPHVAVIGLPADSRFFKTWSMMGGTMPDRWAAGVCAEIHAGADRPGPLPMGSA